MKITIDTKEDSPEELQKVINMLQNLVGSAASVPNAIEGESPGIFNMFGDNSETPSETDTSSNTDAFDTPSTPDTPTEETEESDKPPEMIPY